MGMAHAAAIETRRRMMADIVPPPPKPAAVVCREQCIYTDCGSEDTIRKQVFVSATGKRVSHFCKTCCRYFSTPFRKRPPPDGNYKWLSLSDNSNAPEFKRKRGETDNQYWDRLFAEIDAINAAERAKALENYASNRTLK